jgi:hypothetical protein
MSGYFQSKEDLLLMIFKANKTQCSKFQPGRISPGFFAEKGPNPQKF